ncbi:MAG: hypothetical protein DVB25_07975 [Verrucomicrobia bacterium]|nr:MAG: hypothetical protein DVB25_07975 [Verrucomicrobiota bacterium]
MSDDFTEFSSESWGGRILSSLKGILFGIVLIPISIILLFWNENRAVTTATGLKEGAAAVVSIAATAVVPANDGKLVHLSGQVTSGDEVLKDPLFGVTATGIRLSRSVEMYQWQEDKSSETRKKLGGGTETETTYSYKQVWSDKLISSANFNPNHRDEHLNPTAWLAEPFTVIGKNVRLGAFKLPAGVIAKMHGDETLAATDEDLSKAAPDLRAKLKLAAGTFYVGSDPATPALGDARVSFTVLTPAVWSIIARQNADTLEPYQPKEGSTIERVEAGTVSAELMFKHAASENTILTWGLRLGGFALMALGLGLIVSPLSVFADVIPFLGDIIGFGGALAAMLLAFVGSIIVIAVAWFAVRPLLTVALAVVAAAALVMAWRHGHSRSLQAKPRI